MFKRGFAISGRIWRPLQSRSAVTSSAAGVDYQQHQQQHQHQHPHPHSQPTIESHRQKLTTVFQDIEKQIKLPVDHFLINNLVQSEHDISNFAIQRANKMRPILQHVKHPIYEVARQLFVADKLQLDDGDNLQDFLAKNQLSLGAVVLLLNAHCLASVPAYNQTAAREHWQPVNDPKSAEDSLRNFLCNLKRNKLERQLALAECFELLDKAIYIHDQAVMNFPLKQFLDENEQHPFYNDELRHPASNGDKFVDRNGQTEKVLTFKQQSTQDGGGGGDDEIEMNSRQSTSQPNFAFQLLNEQQMKHCDQINSGNKLSVLGGDYLFSFGITRLASNVRDSWVFDYVGAAIDEYVISQFPATVPESQLFSDVKLPGQRVTMEDYEQQGGCGANKLLAYCLQLVAHLSDLSSMRYQKSSFDMGLYLKLKWNVEEDLKWLHSQKDNSARLFSLPIVLHIIQQPRFANQLKQMVHEQRLNVSQIKKVVINDQILSECERMRLLYQGKAMAATQELPDSESRQTLQKLICL